ncbi:fungal-specific transcription factor domain-containing protein [Mucor mucedo]|uniref:fungal-specific transcription factor domain-containing protein n=1 Tax=Mucor mucedo TaxID=29922 RepID=UPI00221FE8A7|nr:fungal-specific transcription factor domain-containing protein [Mucor mucedo]KAI7892739.1 fungal-specific transcription factor domain-containing protein [Mucor mucedo]
METTIEIAVSKKKSAPILTNLFEEYGVLDPRQWPSGVAYDSIHYLGDLSTLQFFSNKIDEQGTFQGHKIKKIGGNVVLVADPGEPGPSKIPVFHLPEDMHSGEDIHKYIYTVTGVDRYTAVRLLKIYFSHIHPILPVINKTEFLKQYRDRVDTYPPGELLNAMFGAAARFVECESLEPHRKKKLPADAIWDVPVGWSNHFFDQAEYIISKWSNLQTVTNVQAIIIILNHRGDRDSKSSACWQLGGYAHLLGLHRSCEDWDLPKKEKETRNRVWWALYITDRFQTAILGRPINLRDEDINVPYPDPGADIEEVLDAFDADKDRILNSEVFPRFPCLTAPYNYKTNSNREWPQIYELFVQFIKLSEILGRILQGLHTPKAKKFSSQHGSDGLVTRLDYELTQWRNEFPKALKKIQLPDFNEDVGHFAPVIASMLMFYCSSLILLHQPFIQKTSQSKSSHTSLQICTSAAIRGMRIACRLTARDFLMCPYSFTLYPLRQFGLIHMFNSKNPDPKVSTSAKLYLKKGTELLSRIKNMSSTAASLYELFKDMSDTPDTDIITEEIQSVESVSQDGSDDNRGTMASIMDAIMLPTNNEPTKSNVQPEAFSLSQFGYDTTTDTGSLDYILQNLNGLSGFSSETAAYADFATQGHDLFRSDPNNVFWELPSSMEGLNQWIDTMNETGWKVFNQ